MSTFILDLMIRKLKLDAACPRLIRPVCLGIRSDGVKQEYFTKTLNPSPVLQWDAPVRLILSLDTLHNHYIQVSLCQRNETYDKLSIVALSRIDLTSLPAGNPRSISFPLMSCYNTSDVAGIVTMTATISQFVPPQEQFVVTPVQAPIQYSNPDDYSPQPPRPYYSGNQQYNQYQQNYQQYNQFQPQSHQIQQPMYSNQYQPNNTPNSYSGPSSGTNMNYGEQPQVQYYNMPTNPYNQEYDNSRQPSARNEPNHRKVIYPPIQPSETSILYKVSSGNNNNNNGPPPQVIRRKRS